VIRRAVKVARQLVLPKAAVAPPAQSPGEPQPASEPSLYVPSPADAIASARAPRPVRALIDQPLPRSAWNGNLSGRRIVVTGNCTVWGLAAALRMIFPEDSIEHHRLWVEDHEVVAAALADADVWVAHKSPDNEELLERSRTRARRITCPPLIFSGFHPDMVYAWRDGSVFQAAAGDYHSAIGLWAWRRGLDAPEAARLFRPESFRQLGYYTAYQAEIEPLRESFAESGMDFTSFWLRVRRMGVFMHTFNHPRIDVIVLLTKLLALELGMAPELLERPIERYVVDELLPIAVWPVYPELATHLGVAGSYLFAFGRLAFSLDEFLEMQWQAYDDIDPSTVSCGRISDGLYDRVLEPLLTETR
jgi:hypothetical protein